LRETLSSLKSQRCQVQESLTSANAEVKESGAEIDNCRRDILNCESAVSELFVQKEKAANLSTTLREKIEESLAQRNQAEQLVRQKRTEQAQLEEQIHQVKLELSQMEVRETDLVQRVQEELQIDLRQAYENYQQSDIDWQQVREEIGELRGKIERLGNVNLDAIAQQEELQKRDEFLSSQVEDLNKSKSQLEQLIRRINRESKERFRVTFEQIRVNFQELFRKLFGGGRADIIMEEPEDILESGLEIVARPPGKEARSITLLSGGEKAMTAIALLFAIFKAKPSPFCFLDEVDAALDEANNERFNLILNEFEKDSQFIVITHSKRTISIADVLFGITMQTQGVSKKIGVKFDQGEAQQADSPAAVA
jgi:chromosome segregation protein